MDFSFFKPWGERNKVKMEDIETWPAYYAKNKLGDKIKTAPGEPAALVPVNPLVNAKISMWRGDITRLGVDAIVNAANTDLWAGGGVCKSIHDAAGPMLEKECKRIGKCPEGQAVVTGAYDLQAKYVIHAVGPIGEKPPLLRSAYASSYRIMLARNLRTIAFPCISTGIFDYPNEAAALVALAQARTFLEAHHAEVDRVIFAVFLHKDEVIYEKLMPRYFPVEEAVQAAKPEEAQPQDQGQGQGDADKNNGNGSGSEGNVLRLSLSSLPSTSP